MRVLLKTLAGSVTAAGVLVSRRTSKVVAGTISSVGVLSKMVSRFFAGSITPAGVLTKTKVVLKIVAGSITAAGSLVKYTGKSLAGQISSVGGLTKRLSKVAFLGGVTPQGAFNRLPIKRFNASVQAIGDLTMDVLGVLDLGVRYIFEFIINARIYDAIRRVLPGNAKSDVHDATKNVEDVTRDRTHGGFS